MSLRLKCFGPLNMTRGVDDAHALKHRKRLLEALHDDGFIGFTAGASDHHNQIGRSGADFRAPHGWFGIQTFHCLIKFAVAQHLRIEKSEVAKAGRIGLGLDKGFIQLAKHGLVVELEPLRAAKRPVAHPAVHHHGVNADVLGSKEKVVPKLGFHDRNNPRADPDQCAEDKAGNVDGKVEEVVVETFQLLPRGLVAAAGGRGENDFKIGQEDAKLLENGRSRHYLSHGNRVKPDAPIIFLGTDLVVAQPLIPVGRLRALAGAPPHPGHPEGSEDDQEQIVEEPDQSGRSVMRRYASIYFARVFCTTSSGSTGPGGRLSQFNVSR